jgi:hypothetical protein
MLRFLFSCSKVLKMQRKWSIYLVLFSLIFISNLYYYRKPLIESYMRYELKDEFIVVSLSTTPHRIDKIGPTLATILAQKAPIKAIYLNIPYVFRRDNTAYQIPESLLNNHKIKILRSEDYGPATKLLGTLANTDLPANAIIITLDDDVFYPDNIVLQLAFKAKQHPERAIGIIGANPDPDAELGITKIHENDALVSILQGYAGVAYRRHFFDNSIFGILNTPPECINSDDIYLSHYLARHGIQRQVLNNDFVCACDIRWQTDIGTDANSLHKLTPTPAEKHKMCMNFLSEQDSQVVF